MKSFKSALVIVLTLFIVCAGCAGAQSSQPAAAPSALQQPARTTGAPSTLQLIVQESSESTVLKVTELWPLKPFDWQAVTNTYTFGACKTMGVCPMDFPVSGKIKVTAHLMNLGIDNRTILSSVGINDCSRAVTCVESPGQKICTVALY